MRFPQEAETVRDAEEDAVHLRSLITRNTTPFGADACDGTLRKADRLPPLAPALSEVPVRGKNLRQRSAPLKAVIPFCAGFLTHRLLRPVAGLMVVLMGILVVGLLR